MRCMSSWGRAWASTCRWRADFVALIFVSIIFHESLEKHSGKIFTDFYFCCSGRSNVQFFYLAHILCSCTHQYECDDVLDGFYVTARIEARLEWKLRSGSSQPPHEHTVKYAVCIYRNEPCIAVLQYYNCKGEKQIKPVTSEMYRKELWS